MADGRRALGLAAEEVAARALEGAGLVLVERNVRFPEGEIDLVCREGAAWVFVEVKCRHATWIDDPATAVARRKQRRLTRLAQHYLKWRRLGAVACRFDVVAVIVDGPGHTRVRHVRSAFDAVAW